MVCNGSEKAPVTASCVVDFHLVFEAVSLSLLHHVSVSLSLAL